MSVRRFHVQSLSDGVIRITGDEAHHALKTLRLGVGEQVILFDGDGGEADARIVSTARDGFEVEVLSRREVGAPAAQLVIAAAVPKGERAEWMVEKCAELGVSKLVPLLCERSQVRPGPGKIDRWRRKAVEAAKQSRQSRVMAIGEPMTLLEALASAPAGATILFGDVESEQSGPLAAMRDMASAFTLVIIGPEGGLTGQERSAIIQAGGRGARLAGSILRIETAAVAVSAVWTAIQSAEGQ